MTSAGAGAAKPIAVIDLGYIFKNHIRFKAAMDDLKKDADGFEAYLRQQRETAQKMQEKLRTFNAGTPDYKKTEEEMAHMQSDVQVQMTLKKKELMEREAKTYYNIYNEVVAATSDFADRNGISIVIRYSRDPIDKENAQSVLQGVNRPVVFQRNLDITDIVLQKLNGGTAPAPAPVTGGGGGVPGGIGTRPTVPAGSTIPR
jgi:Skp family chaperone for outer membrane proteins